MTDWLQSARQRQQALPVPPPAPPLPLAPLPPPEPVPLPPAPPAPPPVPLVEVDWLDKVKKHTNQVGKPMGTVEEEVARILSLPLMQEEVARCPDPEEYGKRFLSPTTPDPDFRLRPVQIDGLWTFEHYGGLFGPISVGCGKSFIAMLAGIIALKSRGHYRAVIMIPPQVYSQFTQHDLSQARQLFNLHGVAFNICAGSRETRLDIAKRAGPGVWIYSYSSLSTQTGYLELKAIRATCYILDEAHNLANAKSARTKRWRSVLEELTKEGIIEWTKTMTGTEQVQAIETIALSGTITKKRVEDYAHLSTRALGVLSPVPIRDAAIRVFSSVIDSEAAAATLNDRDASVLRTYLTWAEANGFDVTKPIRKNDETDEEYHMRCQAGMTLQERVRQAFMFRLRRSQGVVANTDMGVDSSLLVSWVEPQRPDKEKTEKMVALMQKVVISQETPNGDAIDYSMHQYKWLWEITAGFYNNLVWPSIDKIIENNLRQHDRLISEDQAEMLLAQALKHHNLLQEYHRMLRKFLDQGHIPGCDTPMLVANECIRHIEKKGKNNPLPGWLVDAYRVQREEGPHTYNDLPERFSMPVRVYDYKIKAAVEWAKEHQEGIIWYHHPEIGRWVAELLKEADIPHTFAPAGENEKAYIPGTIVASFAHGTGKNLQHQGKNLFVELRREAAIMEQAIGRTHRSGQKADVVNVHMLIGNGFDLALFNAILKDADYIQSSTGQDQRLCYADYDPVIPPTNPRLMQKLGITKNIVDGITVEAWDEITPPTLKEVADLFRPIAYGKRKAS